MNLRFIASLFSLLAITVIYQSPSNAEAPDGKQMFMKRCSGCHGIDESKEGPRLRGVLGRRAGTVAGFQYSEALRKSNITWTGELINRWLINPDALVHETDMDFHVASSDERAAVIGYLKTLAN